MLQQQRSTVFNAFALFLLECEARQFTKYTLHFYPHRRTVARQNSKLVPPLSRPLSKPGARRVAYGLAEFLQGVNHTWLPGTPITGKMARTHNIYCHQSTPIRECSAVTVVDNGLRN